MSVRVIGIDCATNPKKVGLAFGVFADGVLAIESARMGSSSEGDRGWAEIVETVANEIRGAERALLALDAPLGWPAPMGASLVKHSAGSPLGGTADSMFSRTTDWKITKSISKRPLEVGADRIARTAHSALARLDQIRKKSGRCLPLAWEPEQIEGAQVIEVYPAATLRAWDLSAEGYKGTKEPHREKRESLTDGLVRNERLSGITEVRQDIVKADHTLDAVVCCLAAADFLCGDVIRPEQAELSSAKKEGWIWLKPK